MIRLFDAFLEQSSDFSNFRPMTMLGFDFSWSHRVIYVSLNAGMVAFDVILVIFFHFLYGIYIV